MIRVVATAACLLALGPACAFDLDRTWPDGPTNADMARHDFSVELGTADLSDSGPDIDSHDQRVDLQPPPLDAVLNPDQLPTDSTPSCPGGQYKCVAAESHVCLGGSQYKLDQTCAMGCNSVSGKCYSFAASNGAGAYLVSSGAWQLSGAVAMNTSTGKLSPTQTPGVVQVTCLTGWCVLQANSISIPKGASLKVTGKLPLMVVAQQWIKIDGLVTVSATGKTPGPGGGAGGGAGGAGKGCGGGLAGTGTGFDPVGGGAGGSFGGVGGKGSSAAKATCGGACLVPLQGGSGGGGGQSPGGAGGAGGGALQLTAGDLISLVGVISAGGGGGGGGAIQGGGGGGGGSGGGVLLEAAKVEITGTIAANGGGGGGSGTLTTAGVAGNDGRASAQYADGGAAGKSWFAGKGGQGSAGGSVVGVAGTVGVASGGGGGGGAGRICIRTKSGKHSGAGTLSPSLAGVLTYQVLTPQ